ncbi:MAG: hypothetical protein DCF20_09845 [Pseudanabaena sp.]|nr:MAG: hypothetical protein DCF20_09845 [Pseudanabaena sp.]
MRVILSSIFILLGLGFGTYFYIKEHPITSIDPQGCIVRLSPADDFTIIPFGDRVVLNFESHGIIFLK